MIKELHIENFRCFGKSKLSGFSRINLIGGQNNAGKTAFLEALYLNNLPQVSTLMQMRGISIESIKALPEKAWDSLFLNYNNQLKLTIASFDENQVSTSLQLSRGSQQELLGIINDSERSGKNELSDLFSNHSDSNFSLLNLSYQMGEQNIPISTLVAYSQGIWAKANRLLDEINLHQIYFISAAGKASSKYLAEQYDLCYVQGHSEKVKTAFNIIDPSIQEVRTLTIGQSSIYLVRANEPAMPLAVFGDAMNRVADVILKLVNHQGGILLIDEVENGIHHAHQKDLWKWLFALTAEFNVQIFATTHSLEMLTAFKEVLLETDSEEAGAYLEFARHIKTHEIISIKRDMDNLDHALERHKGVRGE